MSISIDIANAMAARLEAAEALDSLPVVVWKKRTIASELAVKTNKAAGAVAVILFNGFSNASAATGGPTVTRRYTLSIFINPVLSDRDAEENAEEIARTLHNWDPEDDEIAGFDEINVTDADLRPDDALLVYDMAIEVVSRL